MFLARLSVCLILLTTCSARPSWHKGLIKQNEMPLLQVEDENLEIFNKANFNNQIKTRLSRQAPNQFFFNARLQGGIPSFNNHHAQFQFSDRQNFGPILENQQGLQPIGQLASTIQKIIGNQLEATAQLNKEIHFGMLNPPGLRPLHCLSCTHQTHSFHETSHHIKVGHPPMISSQTHTEHFHISCPEGAIGCRDIPMKVHPEVVPPFPSKPEKEINYSQPSNGQAISTNEQQQYGNGEDSDIVYGSDDKETKTFESEENPGIDIRFGGGNSPDVLPLKN